jgi:carbonic anhydrase/acetyltransferase-like protein (isoleucine patch superfamily)
MVRDNGDVVENPRIDGLEVIFQGRLGGVVEIDEGSVFRNTKIVAGGMARIVVKRTHEKGIKNTKIETACLCKVKELYIDSGCSIEGARFALLDDENLSVKIGKDCMLSSNILFRAADGHTLFDVGSGDVINRSRPIKIGDHVWIGAGATFLKGAEVASNVIIGANSIVSKSYLEENVALAGAPARVVKRNVGWSRSRIPEYERQRRVNIQ